MQEIKCSNCKYSFRQIGNGAIVADVKNIPLECRLNPPVNIFVSPGQLQIQSSMTLPHLSCQYFKEKNVDP